MSHAVFEVLSALWGIAIYHSTAIVFRCGELLNALVDVAFTVVTNGRRAAARVRFFFMGREIRMRAGNGRLLPVFYPQDGALYACDVRTSGAPLETLVRGAAVPDADAAREEAARIRGLVVMVSLFPEDPSCPLPPHRMAACSTFILKRLSGAQASGAKAYELVLLAEAAGGAPPRSLSPVIEIWMEDFTERRFVGADYVAF